MKVIVTVVEKLTSEAHINIPDGLSEPKIRQHIVDALSPKKSGSLITICMLSPRLINLIEGCLIFFRGRPP